jgi:hypothetical protein
MIQALRKRFQAPNPTSKEMMSSEKNVGNHVG